MARTPVVVGNWKLNKTLAESLNLVTELKNQLATVRDVEIGVAPVYVSLAAVAKRLEDSNIGVAAQNCYLEASGAFTGEVSAPLLVDAGCKYAIIGHSERRQFFGETDATVQRKVRAALDAGLVVILCVGESEAERDANQTMDRVAAQVRAGISSVEREEASHLIVAYEPIWAIGTGRTATPAQAQEVHAEIRALLEAGLGAAGSEIRIQYGGSVKPANAAELMSQPDIDGALVGGASLKAADFAAIIKASRPS